MPKHQLDALKFYKHPLLPNTGILGNKMHCSQEPVAMENLATESMGPAAAVSDPRREPGVAGNSDPAETFARPSISAPEQLGLLPQGREVGTAGS